MPDKDKNEQPTFKENDKVTLISSGREGKALAVNHDIVTVGFDDGHEPEMENYWHSDLVKTAAGEGVPVTLPSGMEGTIRQVNSDGTVDVQIDPNSSGGIDGLEVNLQGGGVGVMGSNAKRMGDAFDEKLGKRASTKKADNGTRSTEILPESVVRQSIDGLEEDAQKGALDQEAEAELMELLEEEEGKEHPEQNHIRTYSKIAAEPMTGNAAAKVIRDLANEIDSDDPFLSADIQDALIVVTHGGQSIQALVDYLKGQMGEYTDDVQIRMQQAFDRIEGKGTPDLTTSTSTNSFPEEDNRDSFRGPLMREDWEAKNGSSEAMPVPGLGPADTYTDDGEVMIVTLEDGRVLEMPSGTDLEYLDGDLTRLEEAATNIIEAKTSRRKTAGSSEEGDDGSDLLEGDDFLTPTKGDDAAAEGVDLRKHWMGRLNENEWPADWEDIRRLGLYDEFGDEGLTTEIDFYYDSTEAFMENHFNKRNYTNIGDPLEAMAAQLEAALNPEQVASTEQQTFNPSNIGASKTADNDAEVELGDMFSDEQDFSPGESTMGALVVDNTVEARTRMVTRPIELVKSAQSTMGKMKKALKGFYIRDVSAMSIKAAKIHDDNGQVITGKITWQLKICSYKFRRVRSYTLVVPVLAGKPSEELAYLLSTGGAKVAVTGEAVEKHMRLADREAHWSKRRSPTEIASRPE